MNLERKVKRNQAKKAYKKYTEGVKKRDRISFANFWRNFKEEQ